MFIRHTVYMNNDWCAHGQGVLVNVREQIAFPADYKGNQTTVHHSTQLMNKYYFNFAGVMIIS